MPSRPSGARDILNRGRRIGIREYVSASETNDKTQPARAGKPLSIQPTQCEKAKAVTSIAVVTGAASGMGQATTEVLIESDWTVLALDLFETTFMVGDRTIHTLAVDVSDRAAVRQVIAANLTQTHRSVSSPTGPDSTDRARLTTTTSRGTRGSSMCRHVGEKSGRASKAGSLRGDLRLHRARQLIRRYGAANKNDLDEEEARNWRVPKILDLGRSSGHCL